MASSNRRKPFRHRNHIESNSNNLENNDGKISAVEFNPKRRKTGSKKKDYENGCVNIREQENETSVSNEQDCKNTKHLIQQNGKISPKTAMPYRHDLTSALTCPICIDTFYRPCTLQCGHTFCRACIIIYDIGCRVEKNTMLRNMRRNGGINTTTSNVNGSDETVHNTNSATNATSSNTRDMLAYLSSGKHTCPSCRAPTVDSKSLPENIALKGLLLKAFPMHIATREKLDYLLGKRLWIKFLQARSKLESYKHRRELLFKEMTDLRHQIDIRKKECSIVANDCISELRKAQIAKGMLDCNAYILSTEDRRYLATLPHPEEQLTAIDDTLKKMDKSTQFSLLD